ncbi:hypothetical protein JCM10449v2_000351 [Rhodotorula kratochvilovae]
MLFGTSLHTRLSNTALTALATCCFLVNVLTMFPSFGWSFLTCIAILLVNNAVAVELIFVASHRERAAAALIIAVNALPTVATLGFTRAVSSMHDGESTGDTPEAAQDKAYIAVAVLHVFLTFVILRCVNAANAGDADTLDRARRAVQPAAQNHAAAVRRADRTEAVPAVAVCGNGAKQGILDEEAELSGRGDFTDGPPAPPGYAAVPSHTQ